MPAFISMSQLCFGGARILSTVDELWKWEQALAGGKLVGSALLAKAYSEVKLPDGRGTNYGMGWELEKIGNHGTIEHAGGFPGFAAEELRIADAGIYIAILSNGSDLPKSPHDLGRDITAAVVGRGGHGGARWWRMDRWRIMWGRIGLWRTRHL